MVKILYSLIDFLGGRSGRDAATPLWCNDPLAHPAIRGMSLEMVADLPFDPYAACRDEPAQRGGTTVRLEVFPPAAAAPLSRLR